MEKLYYTAPYLKSTQCRIEKIIQNKANVLVYTNPTIFYPECGGQPGDRGFLGAYKVQDTRKDEDGNSVLVIQEDVAFKEGDSETLTLDWKHRHKYMVMHTAQHMLSGLLYTMFSIGTVAVHLGEDYLTIEVDQNEVLSSTIEQLVSATNNAIKENHKVVYHQMSHEKAQSLGLRRSIKVDGDVRIVEIEGVDRIACGGVHVQSTSEIRLLYYVKQEIIRGHVRLYFKCGDIALESALEDVKICESLALKLTCRSSELIGKIENLNDALNNANHAKNNAMKCLAGYRLRESIKDDISTIIVDNDFELSSFAHASNEIENLAFCSVKIEKDRTLWLIVLKGKFEKINFNELRTTLLPMIEAKGGGKTPVFQGSSPCVDEKTLQAFLEKFKEIAKAL